MMDGEDVEIHSLKDTPLDGKSEEQRDCDQMKARDIHVGTDETN
jgi:hypothetical protein